ncbi:MAG: hypothetical protein HQ582_24360 [Planctomycetes bacterium]|nr:hypothetical protein [Planctomycetota bacterium]
MKTTDVVWMCGSFGYLLSLVAEESAHDKCAEDIYKLLESFEELKTEPDGSTGEQ